MLLPINLQKLSLKEIISGNKPIEKGIDSRSPSFSRSNLLNFGGR